MVLMHNGRGKGEGSVTAILPRMLASALKYLLQLQCRHGV